MLTQDLQAHYLVVNAKLFKEISKYPAQTAQINLS